MVRKTRNGEETWTALVLGALTRKWVTVPEVVKLVGGDEKTIGQVLYRLHRRDGIVEKGEKRGRYQLWRKASKTALRRRESKLLVHPQPGTAGPCRICGDASADITLRNGVALELCFEHYQAVQPYLIEAAEMVPAGVANRLSVLENKVRALEAVQDPLDTLMERLQEIRDV